MRIAINKCYTVYKLQEEIKRRKTQWKSRTISTGKWFSSAINTQALFYTTALYLAMQREKTDVCCGFSSSNSSCFFEIERITMANTEEQWKQAFKWQIFANHVYVQIGHSSSDGIWNQLETRCPVNLIAIECRSFNTRLDTRFDDILQLYESHRIGAGFWGKHYARLPFLSEKPSTKCNFFLPNRSSLFSLLQRKNMVQLSE